MLGWTVRKERMSGVERCRDMVHHESSGRSSTIVCWCWCWGFVLTQERPKGQKFLRYYYVGSNEIPLAPKMKKMALSQYHQKNTT